MKLTAVSEVTVGAARERAVGGSRPSHREEDPLVRLSRHSYQAGLWDADTMGRHQYAEGLRRGVDRCQRLSSVNDGSPCIVAGLSVPGWPLSRKRPEVTNNSALYPCKLNLLTWTTFPGIICLSAGTLTIEPRGAFWLLSREGGVVEGR